MVRVTIFSGLVVPETTFPKFTAVGDNEVAAMPVPVNETASGLLEALLLMDSEPPARAPRAEGVQVSEMVQLAPAASEEPHAVGAPEFTTTPAEGVIEAMVNGVDWKLNRVAVLARLGCPITTLLKLIEVGDTAVGAMPVAVSGTVSGVLAALVATLSDAAGAAPRAVGVTSIETAQLAPAFRLAPQVVPVTA